MAASGNVSVVLMLVETTLGQQGSSCPFKGHQAEFKLCELAKPWRAGSQPCSGRPKLHNVSTSATRAKGEDFLTTRTAHWDICRHRCFDRNDGQIKTAGGTELQGQLQQ